MIPSFVSSAAYFLGLLTGASASSIPKPTGEFYIGYTQHVFDHITENDPLAGTGEAMVMTVYYPTLHEPNNTTPYLHPILAGLYETGYKITPGLYKDLTAPITFQAPTLNESTGRPTLFFSPGGGGNTEIDRILIIDLASHGYVVAAFDHPYEPAYTQFPYGGPGAYGLPVRYRYGLEFADYMFEYRVPDFVAAMKFFPPLAREFGAPFNTTHFGLFGFSIGGAAAAEAITNTITDGEYGDLTLIGGINLDGTLFGKASQGGPEADTKVPFLQFGGDRIIKPGDPSWPQGGDETWTNFSSAQTGYFREIIVEKAHHLDFCDFSFWKGLGESSAPLGGPIDGLYFTQIMRRYVKAFFDVASGLPPAEGDEGLLDNDGVEFPEVKIRNKN